MTKQTTLEILRKKIDEIDKELLQIIAKRIDLAKQIAAKKKSTGLPILDTKRWQQVLQSNISKGVSLKLSREFIEKLFSGIHEYTIEIEEEIYEKG